jgi:hypothetical protein
MAHSPYLWSSVVYLVYTIHLVGIENCPRSCDTQGWSVVNQQYVVSAGLHLVTAMMFAWAWRGCLQGLTRLEVVAVLCPEVRTRRGMHVCFTNGDALMVKLVLATHHTSQQVLNVVEACLFITSATLYPLDSKCRDLTCHSLIMTHRIELAASLVRKMRRTTGRLALLAAL